MNDLQRIKLTDLNFQSQHAAKCDLLIRISDNRLSYAVVDQIQDQLKLLYDELLGLTPSEALEIAFAAEPVLKYHYRKVKIAVETSSFTFIPTEVYAQEQLPVYSMFSTAQAPATTYVNQIKGSGINNIISVAASLKEVAITRFKSPLIYSQAEPFIGSMLKYYYTPIGLQLFIQLNGPTFEMLLTDGKKIKFYNLFQSSSTEELNYFLLFAINQLEISAPEIPVILSGEISEGDEQFNCIRKYFKHTRFADTHNLMRVPEAFNSITKHRFFSLLSLNVCG